NARYLSAFYESLGYKIDDILYTPKNFDKFKPSGTGKKDYVLTYIGKETDIQPILDIASMGVKIKGFGSKLPVGISVSKVRQAIEYLGFVSDDELVDLYSGALFTAFPFTEEPFGYVPIESMACGTPVLSYNKGGPSETIVDGKTGWLVSSREEFVEKAMNIWKNGHNLKEDDCISRASAFKTENVVLSLMNLLNKQ
ncbi:MAG: glycosyltransferase, partial [Nitrososphaerota archaeon]